MSGKQPKNISHLRPLEPPGVMVGGASQCLGLVGCMVSHRCRREQIILDPFVTRLFKACEVHFCILEGLSSVC